MLILSQPNAQDVCLKAQGDVREGNKRRNLNKFFMILRKYQQMIWLGYFTFSIVTDLTLNKAIRLGIFVAFLQRLQPL